MARDDSGRVATTETPGPGAWSVSNSRPDQQSPIGAQGRITKERGSQGPRGATALGARACSRRDHLQGRPKLAALMARWQNGGRKPRDTVCYNRPRSPGTSNRSPVFNSRLRLRQSRPPPTTANSQATTANQGDPLVGKSRQAALDTDSGVPNEYSQTRSIYGKTNRDRPWDSPAPVARSGTPPRARRKGESAVLLPHTECSTGPGRRLRTWPEAGARAGGSTSPQSQVSQTSPPKSEFSFCSNMNTCKREIHQPPLQHNIHEFRRDSEGPGCLEKMTDPEQIERIWGSRPGHDNNTRRSRYRSGSDGGVASTIGSCGYPKPAYHTSRGSGSSRGNGALTGTFIWRPISI